MNTVTVRLVRKSNGKSAVYLAYGKPIILPDGSKRKSESLKIDIHTVPKNNAEMRYNDKVMEIVEYVRCNRQIEKIRNQFNMGHIDRMDDSFLDYIDEKAAFSQISRYNGIKVVLKACFRKEIRFKDIKNGSCEEFRATHRHRSENPLQYDFYCFYLQWEQKKRSRFLPRIGR